MENATCVIPWALGEAECVEQAQVRPGTGPRSDWLGRWLGGTGDGGWVLGNKEPLAFQLFF